MSSSPRQLSFSLHCAHGPGPLGGRASCSACFAASSCASVTRPHLQVLLRARAIENQASGPRTFSTNTSNLPPRLRNYVHRTFAHCFMPQCYVVAAAQVGSHSAKRASYGHAMCVDPWGKIIAEAGGRPYFCACCMCACAAAAGATHHLYRLSLQHNPLPRLILTFRGGIACRHLRRHRP
jgi:predicted amidohydrolase